MKITVDAKNSRVIYNPVRKLGGCFLLILFFLIPYLASGQASPLESLPIPELKLRIKTTGNDTNRVKLLLILSRVTLFKSADKNRADTAFVFMTQAEKLSNSLHYTEGQGNSLLMAALVYNYRNQRDKGMMVSQKALDLFKQSNNQRGIAEAYVIIGQHYNDNIPGEMSEKMKYYQMAVDQFIKVGSKFRAGSALQDLGNLYVMINKPQIGLSKFHEAMIYYQSAGRLELQGLYDLIGVTSTFETDYVTGLKYELLAVKTAETFKDSTLQLSTIYFRTGYVYYLLREFSEADIYFQKALVVSNRYRDSASIAMITYKRIQALTKLRKYQQALTLDNQLMAMFPNMEADDKSLDLCAKITIYLLQKQYDQAKPYVFELLKYSGKINLIDHIYIPILPVLISYDIGTGNFKHCYPYLRLMDSALRKHKIPQTRVVLENLWFKADSGMGKYKSAIVHFQRAKLINDSLYNATKAQQINSLEIAYETEKKDQDIRLKANNILLLNKQSQLKDIELNHSRTTRNLLTGGGILLLIIIGLGYNRYRIKQRSNLLLTAQQQQINQQYHALQELLVEKNELIAEKDHLLSDKDLLLKEVHHRVKNNLQIVMSLLEAQSAYLDNRAALEALLDSQNRVRAIALIHHKLYSSESITKISMQSYIPDLIDDLKACLSPGTQFIAISQSIDDITLDVVQAIPVGIILNEVITNAIKYAFPNRGNCEIRVEMKNVNDAIRLEISDNGIGLPNGFDIKNAKSLGMSLISGLTKQLKGDFSISTEKGVSIVIQFAIDLISISAIRQFDDASYN